MLFLALFYRWIQYSAGSLVGLFSPNQQLHPVSANWAIMWPQNAQKFLSSPIWDSTEAPCAEKLVNPELQRSRATGTSQDTSNSATSQNTSKGTSYIPEHCQQCILHPRTLPTIHPTSQSTSYIPEHWYEGMVSLSRMKIPTGKNSNHLPILGESTINM